MLSALVIMWLYVSGGILIYALAEDSVWDGDRLIYGVAIWPLITIWMLLGAVMKIMVNLFTGIRGVIGK